MTDRRVPAAGEGLTGRELEVLELAAQGLSNGQIGGRLFLAEDTVKNHMSRLTRKLGASGRTEAVSEAYRRGLFRGEPGPVPVPVSSVPVAQLSAFEALVAVAEAVVAGRPLASFRREALEALTAAGRRGPGGRPLPSGVAPVSIPASRTPGDLRAGSGSSRAPQSVSGALRPVPGAIPSGAEVPG